MTGRLEGKVAIITGASRGLGQYCAERFAAEGASVVAVARSFDQERGAAPERAAGTITPITCDVGHPSSIGAMAKQVLDRFGRIDVLMTNAVYYAPGSFSTMAPDDWNLQFQVNVHGVFHAIRAVLPTMIEQGSGNIITVSSIAAERGSHYGATKQVVATLTAGFASEQKVNGIAVNSLRPVAAIRTPGWLQSRPPEVLEKRAHRVSPPDSYVEAAVLLAMRDAEECTGQAFTDAEVVQRFGTPESLARFRDMNAPVWSESLQIA